MRNSILLVISVLFLFSSTVGAQKLTTKSEKARDLYHKGEDSFYISQFDVAEDYLLKSIKIDPNFLEALI